MGQLDIEGYWYLFIFDYDFLAECCYFYSVLNHPLVIWWGEEIFLFEIVFWCQIKYIKKFGYICINYFNSLNKRKFLYCLNNSWMVLYVLFVRLILGPASGKILVRLPGKENLLCVLLLLGSCFLLDQLL